MSTFSPSPFVDPSQRIIRTAVLVMMLVAVAGASLAAWLHWNEPHQHPISLVLPPFLAASYLLLAGLLWWRPQYFRVVIWLAFAAALNALVLPTWYFTWEASTDPGKLLTDTLPPVSALLLPLILAVIVVFPPRQALFAAVGGWLLVAAPVLSYLVLHPAQLWQPRGLDLIIVLGPVMIFLLVYIPLRHALEQVFENLRVDHQRMRLLAERDILTGLHNRRSAENLLIQRLSDADRAGLILFDIDHFKRINDTHGHPIGDAVLQEVSQRCALALRQDDVLARWGGEEFLVLVNGAGLPALERIAESLRASLCASRIEPVGIVTASFGVCQLRSSETAAAALARIDEALYAAKTGGRNRVVCA
jgi:diguanylate cyclase (GGDEF)-like protein